MTTRSPRQSGFPSPRQPGIRRHASTSGMVLLVVLCLLVLVSILVVAFLSSATTELRSAKTYQVGLNAQALSDSAVNVVVSQIQDATSVATNAWASQPGMIRTWDSSGSAAMSYKLYSSDTMRVTGAFNAAASVGTEVPTTWSSQPDLYTDLNAPVTVSSVSHYPIVDPSAVANGQGSTTAVSGTNAPIEGCYLDTSNAAVATSSSQSNPVPMPVKWLYVLKDGSLTTISSSGTIASATTANPVVGRIAFWTDDETCKINVNTSSEGTFWDRPHTESAKDASGNYTGYERAFLANSLPMQNEFQRYPGHPAMTSLSVVFPPQDGESTHDYNERVYGIIPRVVGGGSESGTVAVSTSTASVVPDTQRLFSSVDEFLFSAANRSVVNLKSPTTNFSETDIARTRFFLTANSRAPEVNMFNKPRVTIWPLQANTADVSTPSAAVNRTAKDQLIAKCSTIGNTPYYFQRYNTFDTSTIRTSGNSYPGSLSQSPIPSSQSPTMDWTNIPRNQSLYLYLKTLCSTNIPGFGGKLFGSGGKYQDIVGQQILTEIMDFIRSEVTTASTGTTPSFFYAPGQQTGTLVTGERQIVPLVIPATSGITTVTTKGYGRFETITQAALVFYRMNQATISGNSSTGYTATQNPTAPSSANPIKIGMVLLLNPWNPTPGSRPWCENMRISVTGLSGIKINNQTITVANGSPMPDSSASSNCLLLTGINDTVNCSPLMGPEYFFRYNNVSGGTGYKPLGATTVGASDEENYYPFFGSFNLTTTAGLTSFNFTPPTSIVIKIYSGYATSLNAGDLVQTITMNWPNPSGGAVTLPTPTVNFSQGQTSGVYSESDGNLYTDFNARIGSTPNPSGGNYPEKGIDEDSPSPQHNPSPFICTGDTVRSIEARYKAPANGDLRVLAGLPSVPQQYFNSYGSGGFNANSPAADDPSPGATGYVSSTTALVHSMRMLNNPNGTANNFGAYTGCGGSQGRLINSSTTPTYYQVGAGKQSSYPIVPRNLTPLQVQLIGNDAALHPGDWDTGPGQIPDGPYINKPDESNSGYNGAYTLGCSQYAGKNEPEEQGNTYSPNRQISSAVAFGSLPTGIDQSNNTALASTKQSSGGTGIRPWQTLLFNPVPAAGTAHPGFGENPTGTVALSPPYTIPPDWAFLDLFTMPVVEPYAISEPFSTAGKINMNYQIVPFTYLTRDTGVRAVLKSTRLMVIPSTDTGQTSSVAYKVASTNPPDYRYTVNPDEVSGTLAGFQNRFASGDIFRSASEICGIPLVPQYLVNYSTSTKGESISTTTPSKALPSTPTLANMNAWWDNNGATITSSTQVSGTYALTGDNLREQPYGNIYPRLTTKSNSYTVYVRAQSIKKAINTPVDQIVDGTDQISSEYRGSFIVQRYLDPNSDSLIRADGGAASETDPNSMVGPYKYRVVATKRFAP